MADWTAITGIVVSGVVGPAVGAWYANRRLAQEHEYGRVLADRAELRQLLDEAEQALRRAGRLGQAFEGLFQRFGVGTRVRASTHYDRFREAAREADIHAGRLALRLGAHHAAAVAYQTAFRATYSIEMAVTEAHALGDFADLAEIRDQLEAGVSAFDEAHGRFLEASTDLVRSQLAPRRAWSRAMFPFGLSGSP